MALSQDEILYAKSRKAEMPDISSDMLMDEIDQLRSSIEEPANGGDELQPEIFSVGKIEPVVASPAQTRGERQLSEAGTQLSESISPETIRAAEATPALSKERFSAAGDVIKAGVKGIGGAISRTAEKATEGFGDLASIIGVATAGVDLDDEQKAQIFEDLEIEKATKEYKALLSKKADQLKLVGSFGIPTSRALQAGAKASTLVKTGLGALAGAEAVTLDRIATEGELPSKGELATGAAFGAVIPSGVKALARGKEVLGKTVPAQLLKSALKLTPTQKTKLTQLTVGGDDIQALAQRGASPEQIAAAQSEGNVFDWLVEKGYKGEPKDIGIQLAVDSANARKVKKGILSKVTGKFRDETGTSAPSQILADLVEVFTGSRGNEQKLLKAQGYLNDLKSSGLELTELDDIKTFFDQNSSIFKAAGLGDAKAGAKSQGLATLRKELKEFIEGAAKESGDIRQVNKDISAARSASEAILERADAAGGNAIFKLTDIILGGAAGGGEFARSQDPIKALEVGFGVAVGKRLFSNPKFQTGLAKALQKTFSEGEAGIILKTLQGESVDITGNLKAKFRKMMNNIVDE